MILETLPEPLRLISVSVLDRFFIAGASIACGDLRYRHVSALIVDDELGPHAIASLFKLSASRSAKVDCAFVLLCGSISKYRAAPPATWSAEPEAGICRTLVGGDFPLISDQATKFVAKHWIEIRQLVYGAEAA